jgi:hypothetical protein
MVAYSYKNIEIAARAPYSHLLSVEMVTPTGIEPVFQP